MINSLTSQPTKPPFFFQTILNSVKKFPEFIKREVSLSASRKPVIEPYLSQMNPVTPLHHSSLTSILQESSVSATAGKLVLASLTTACHFIDCPRSNLRVAMKRVDAVLQGFTEYFPHEKETDWIKRY
jgi:hypothetical protein